MPRSSAPPVITSIDTLEPKFRDDVAHLLDLAASDGLPVRLFETRRSLERQAWLFAHGVSRAAGANGPHCWGLAADIILEVKHQFWNTHNVGTDQRPQKVGGGGAEWDTGVEMRGASCMVIRPHVAEVWRRVGAMGVMLGMTWGGTNEGPWKSSRPGDLFGWDVAHVQMRGWAKYRETARLPSPA